METSKKRELLTVEYLQSIESTGEVIKLLDEKGITPLEKAMIETEVIKRGEAQKEKLRLQRQAKELEMQEERERYEREQAEKRAQQEEHEKEHQAFLATEEGQRWKEQEDIRLSIERAQLAQARQAREQQEAIEARERAEQEAKEESERRRLELENFEHEQWLQEEYEPEDIARIKQSEQILKRRLKPEEISGKYSTKAKQWCTDIEVITDRGHPRFGAAERYYSRKMNLPEATRNKDIYLQTFLHKFMEKFRPQNQNNNAITNNNTNQSLVMPPPGSNPNDVAIVTYKEATAMMIEARTQMREAFNFQKETNAQLKEALKEERSHIVALTKQSRKSEERAGKAQIEGVKSELKLLRERRKYLKKHPFVAGMEGLGKAVEEVGGIVTKFIASPEEKAKIEAEEARLKALKKAANNEAVQELIKEAVSEALRADRLARGVKE